MCIVVIAWKILANQPLILLSNRDEFYQRSSQTLHRWQSPPIFGGKDLKENGTWMAVNAKNQRWAVLTNYREMPAVQAERSRGALVTQFVNSTQSMANFNQQLTEEQSHYSGFNFMYGDVAQAWTMSNRGVAPMPLASGVYVLSNGLIDDEWPKMHRLRLRFSQEFLPLLQQHGMVLTDDVQKLAWHILHDQQPAPTVDLPKTGVPLMMEELLSPIFIQSKNYGTHVSNLLRLSVTDLHWFEKTYVPKCDQDIVEIYHRYGN